MTLSFYFFRQFIPPFIFGTALFSFVLIMDKLFDLIDLIFNKGVNAFLVGKLFLLFVPTILPLTLPMAVLLACLMTFGRLSEENELTAVRSGGISFLRVLWLPPVFGLVMSLILIPINSNVAPKASSAFRTIFEKIIHADPLINIEAKKFFSIKNIKIFVHNIDQGSNELKNIFVYQMQNDNSPPDRVFAKEGTVKMNANHFQMDLKEGHLERYDTTNPASLIHTAFGTYQVSIPLEVEEKSDSVRFRNLTSHDLKKLTVDLQSKGLPINEVKAEISLRAALAFAPLALMLVGIPFATTLKRGGKTFGFGITLVLIFLYYLLLIFGLTLAEKNVLPAPFALWIANTFCFLIGLIYFGKMTRQ